MFTMTSIVNQRKETNSKGTEQKYEWTEFNITETKDPNQLRDERQSKKNTFVKETRQVYVANILLVFLRT